MIKEKNSLKKEFKNSDLDIELLIKDVDGCDKLSKLLKIKTGINLPTSNKKNIILFASRLIKKINKLNFNNFNDYHDYLQNCSINDSRMEDFITLITTNTTEFFRENFHFEKLKEILQEITRNHKKELRIWCAASSSGQEVYSILITIQEFFLLNNTKKELKFLATDIDSKILEKAMLGIYSEDDVKNIPMVLKNRYFLKAKQYNNKFVYTVRDNYKNIIKFALLNLSDSNEYKFRFKFDLIFCRNVLIYFDQDMAKKVITNLENSLEKNGYLFLGHSESGLVSSNKLTKLNNSIFRRKE